MADDLEYTFPLGRRLHKMFYWFTEDRRFVELHSTVFPENVLLMPTPCRESRDSTQNFDVSNPTGNENTSHKN